MKRVKDGWSLKTCSVIQYQDGTIKWDYSTGGYFLAKSLLLIVRPNAAI